MIKYGIRSWEEKGKLYMRWNNYEIDLGDHRETWSHKGIQEWYKNNADKAEYPTFDIWWDDMIRMGLITEVA